MIDSSKYLAEGLAHKIYRISDRIYKVPKDSFEDFNTYDHFTIERISHEILIQNNIPAVPVLRIYEKGEILPDKLVLEEEYIKGEIKDNCELSISDIHILLGLMMEVNKVRVDGFGNIGASGVSSYSSWRDYLYDNLIEARGSVNQLSDKTLEEIYLKSLKSIDMIPILSEGKFLMLDTNANNFIFDKNNKIIALLDIDHPASGDPLYEYAALKWYHPNRYKILTKDILSLSKEEERLIGLYYLYFGFSILDFEIKHNLNIEKSREKIYAKQKEI